MASGELGSGRSMRQATFAGSWYEGDASRLAGLASRNLANVAEEEKKKGTCTAVRETCLTKAIICPHAGFSYSGATAAHSWTTVNPLCFDRVVLIGLSHKGRVRKCALPARHLTAYDTPLGALQLDLTALSELRDLGVFEELSQEDDEHEHSLELQLPYLKFVFSKAAIKIIPIYVGGPSIAQLDTYATPLKKYFDDERTLFVISSDFCHWGRNYQYYYIKPSHQPFPIYQAIQVRPRLCPMSSTWKAYLSSRATTSMGLKNI